MHDTNDLYHGTIALVNTESGEKINVAVQVLLRADEMAYTIKSLVCGDHCPTTLHSNDPGELRVIRALLDEMRRVSVPV